MLLIMQPSKVLNLIHFSQKVFHFKTTKVRDKKGGKAMFHQVCVCGGWGGGGVGVVVWPASITGSLKLFFFYQKHVFWTKSTVLSPFYFVSGM